MGSMPYSLPRGLDTELKDGDEVEIPIKSERR